MVLSNATKWISASDWYGPIQTQSAPFCFDNRLSHPRSNIQQPTLTQPTKLYIPQISDLVETSEIKGGPDTILFAV